MKQMKTLTYRILALTGCLLALMLGGCVKNEFKVDFEFPKDHIGNYLMTYYAWDSRGGRWMEHTASIQEGMATADGITRLPTLVYISDASQNGNSMVIYVERGDKIRISGDGRDMASWTVTGNKLSERWSEWRKTSYPKKDDVKAMHKSIEEYVKKNPKDELSSILLLTEWNRREDPSGFVSLWNSIDKTARSQQLIEMSGASDLLGVEFITTAEGNLEYAKDPKLKSVVVRSLYNGLDSLVFSKPSILFFYYDINSARREAVDSLKMLTKAYPDSAKRIMADIYVDSDSSTWANAIRRDSLKGVVRAWQPHGVADEDMVKMGVTRLPWFIVKDKTAKETYAGSELKDAVAAFRRLMGKPDSKAIRNTAKTDNDNKETGKSQPKPESKPKEPQKPKAAPLRKVKPLTKEP
ncbi:MAG: hypothetical protein K2J58_02080 [Muribaculaceae bacterium]|nr:hypothetical protein [Muribaculaceae bacterium]